jgi:hypothetical protein
VAQPDRRAQTQYTLEDHPIHRHPLIIIAQQCIRFHRSCPNGQDFAWMACQRAAERPWENIPQSLPCTAQKAGILVFHAAAAFSSSAESDISNNI